MQWQQWYRKSATISLAQRLWPKSKPTFNCCRLPCLAKALVSRSDDTMVLDANVLLKGIPCCRERTSFSSSMVGVLKRREASNAMGRTPSKCVLVIRDPLVDTTKKGQKVTFDVWVLRYYFCSGLCRGSYISLPLRIVLAAEGQRKTGPVVLLHE